MAINNRSSQVVRKVFVCNNGKCAATTTANEIFEELNEKVHDLGMDDYDAPLRIKCLISGCLDVCENGPVMVVHPGATYYQRVNREVLQRIFEEHLLNGKVVSEYVHKHKNQAP